MKKNNIRWKRVIAMLLAVVVVVTSNSFMSAMAAGTEEDMAKELQAEPVLQDPVEETVGGTEDVQMAEEAQKKAADEQAAAELRKALEVPVLVDEPVAVADENLTFDIAASVSEKEVFSGAEFNYYISYTVPPLESGKSYTSMSILINLPEHVSVRANDDKSIQVTGQDVQSAFVVGLGDRTSNLTINLNRALTAGEAKTITVNLKTTNFRMENDTIIDLKPVLTGRADGLTVTGSIQEGQQPKVTVKADDGWNIEKEAGEVDTSNDEFYLVPYTLVLKNQKSGVDADWDRAGRLAMESFLLTDTLPTGFPQGGGASEIVSVKMGESMLEAGTDYVVSQNPDGAVTKVDIKTMAMTGQDYNFVGKDMPITTTYTMLVKYPRSPYITPSNQPLKKYTLENTAKLTYQLLGQGEEEGSAHADIELGEKEKAGTSYDITVEKILSIENEQFPIKDTNLKASFALYEDPECTTIANDISGEHLEGTEQETGKNGTVTFLKLRYGDYYLKETIAPKGFHTISAAVKVTISATGAITVGPEASIKDGVIQIIDTTDTLGIVQFNKYGEDSEGKTSLLPGATFVLTNQADKDKKYEAVSDKNGRVRFLAVPAGMYSLKEKDIKNDEYITSDKEIKNIEVKGNQVTEPSGLDDITVEGKQVTGFLNVSPKGRFKIQKVDSITNGGLAGAQFKVYGPFDEDVTEVPEDAKPIKNQGADYIVVTDDSGVATSIALEAGTYLLDEIKAPEGYGIRNKITKVEITARKTTETVYQIPNDAKLPFTIRKQGVVQNGAYTEELAGAVFEIYDSEKKLIDTITTYLDGAAGSTSKPILMLTPGTYYYKETKAPEGYQIASDELVEFTLQNSNSEDPMVADPQLTVKNHAEYGQIKVIKVDALAPHMGLGGAEFAIYTDRALTEKVNCPNIITAAGTGVGLSVLLPKGKYYLKEVKAPEGYALYPNVVGFEVTIEKDQQVEIEIKNNGLKNIQIMKKDSKTGNPMEGVMFGIYTDSEGKTQARKPDGITAVVPQMTNSNGICTFSELQPNAAYYVKELGTKEGYVLDGTVRGPIQTAAGDVADKVTAVTYTNDRKADFMVTKTTDMDAAGGSKPLVGVTFTLYQYDADQADGKGTSCGEKTTSLQNEKAVATWTDLDPGEYILSETKQPEGYGPIEDRKIHLEPGENKAGYSDVSTDAEALVENHAIKGKLEIEKVSSLSPDIHVAAEFRLYKEDKVSAVATLTTDAKNGRAVSDWLEPGTYYLQENMVDDAYVIDKEWHKITIEAAKTTLLTNEGGALEAIKNVPKGKVRIEKNASFGVQSSTEKVTYPLVGATFQLFSKTTEGLSTDVTKEPEDTIVMTTASDAMSKLLVAGEYWIVETKFPEGYQMDAEKGTKVVLKDGSEAWAWNEPCTVIAGVVDSAEVPSVKIDNITEKGKIHLYKRAFTNTGTLLDGADFEVYKLDPKGEEYTLDDGTTVKLVKVKASASSDGKGDIMQSGTDGAKTGGAVSLDLDAGTYYLKEVIDANGASTIPGGVKWYPYQLWTEVVVEKGMESKVTICNYNKEGTGQGEKKKGETDAGLEGALFGAFENEAQALEMKNRIEGENISVYNANFNTDPKSLTEAEKKILAQYKKEIGDNIFQKKNGIAATTKSGKNGTFEFTGLVPGKTYYVMELLAPGAYDINTEIKSATVKGMGESGFVETDLRFNDFQLGRLSVVKYTKIGDVKYTVNGVSFKVYKASFDTEGTYIADDGKKYKKASETAVATGKSAGKGIYTSIFLASDIYIVEEDSVDDAGGIVSIDSAEKNYRVVTVDSEKTNATYATTEDGKGFFNPAAKGKFLVKKKVNGGNSGVNANVTFKLQKKGDSGVYTDYQENGKDKSTFSVKTNGALYESDYLPTGEYQIYETAGVGMTLKCTKENPIQFKITPGDFVGSPTDDIIPGVVTDNTHPLTVTNDKQGSLKIAKAGAFQGTEIEKLKDVTFSLYRAVTEDGAVDCENKKNLVATQNTDQNGSAVWTNLDAGDYWLQEKELGPNDDKYQIGTAIQKITIKVGGSTELIGENQIYNTTTYGKLKIKKVDANNTEKGLEATFEVYSDKDCTKRVKDILGNDAVITTDKQGMGVSTPLPLTTDTVKYYLKETIAPSGYLAEKAITGPYEVNTKNDITDASNTPILNQKAFQIKVMKVHSKDLSEIVKGATIGLFSSEDDAADATKALQTKVTDVNGVAVFDKLKVAQESGEKTYWVKEVKAPPGYDLNPTAYPVVVKYSDYQLNGTDVFTWTIEDDKLGNLALQKIGSWQGIDDTSIKDINLAGVKFFIYKVADKNAVHGSDDKPVDEITTDVNGLAQTKNGLQAGWYEVVEAKAPDGYAEKTETAKVEVKNDTINTELTGDGAIVNVPNKGRFVLEKYDGAEGLSNLTMIGNSQQAIFELERYDEEKGDWVYNNEAEKTFAVSAQRYLSGALLPGKYRVTETQAPIYQYEDSNKNMHTIHFKLDSTPIEFTIKAGITGAVTEAGENEVLKIYNSPQGNIKLTKTGEDISGAGSSTVIDGAAFKLYTDNACLEEVKDSLRITENGGICKWEQLDPGTYYVKEVETDASKELFEKLGYGINPEPQEVVITPDKLVSEIAAATEEGRDDLTETVAVINQADKGRILIKKQDEEGKALSGAEFAIYTKTKEGTWEKEPIDTVIITEAGGERTKLLPADSDGTPYKVVETKAPAGYTLDSSLSGYETEQIVTVYPLHMPADSSDKNVVTFKNKRRSKVTGFSSEIKKSVRETDSTDDETTFDKDGSNRTEVTASQSLLKQDYNVAFQLSGYTEGKNEIGASIFTVTDNDIVLQYEASANNYKDVTPTQEDYQMNSVEVKAAKNGDVSKRVSATVYVQKTLEEKKNNTWTQYASLPDITENQSISFGGESVIGIKVEYGNVQAGFTSDGTVLDVTFKNRGGWSTKDDHEVRKIVNKANLTWADRRLDESGKETTESVTKGNVSSNVATLLLPPYSNKLPQIGITNEILDKKTTYYSGDSIKYQVKAKNYPIDGQEEVLEKPVISIRMPACTTVDASKFADGFWLYKRDKNGTETVIPNSRAYYSMRMVPGVSAPLKYEGDDRYEESESLKTTQYVFEFTKEVELEEDEELYIVFYGMISYESKKENGVTSLVCPSYLSSAEKVPSSVENPLGLSFVSYEGAQKLHDNSITSDEIETELQYLNATNTATVTDSTAVKLVKYIGTKDENGKVNYLNMGETAHVNPGGNIYYKLTLYNNSTDYIQSARLVDILPFNGDSFVMAGGGGSFTARGTTAPLGGKYDTMKLLNADGQDGAGVEFYSTEYDWSSRSSDESQVGNIMGPMYHRNDEFANVGWALGSSEDASALAAQIDFGTEGLASGESYDVYIEMQAPGYTADQINDYYEKVIANSAMVSVTRKSTTTPPDVVEYQDRAEPNKAVATLDLPTGSIGDYVWYDANNDGTQDADEEKADGIEVSLYKTTFSEINGRVNKKTELADSCATNQDGHYEFKDLYCAYLKEGAVSGSTNPTDYVGEEYYTYEVQFKIPKGYAATVKGAADPAVDSDINAEGRTDPVTLAVEERDRLLYGEANMDIDAGLISPYSLGDTVWLDQNNNGLQEANEPGVAGVPVFLYKVKTADDKVTEEQKYYARTETDSDGHYEFRNLQEGYYVVEFDVSDIRKPDGYTYKYDFTEITEVSERHDKNSDAKHSVDNERRIRRTDVITLSEERLLEDGVYEKDHPGDMRWDAGLVVYSALGGFCFDDQDYDNLESLYIPLLGVKVELYELHNGVMDEKPLASQMAGADGRYYFDHLVFDGESQNYKVRFVFPDGYMGVESNVGSDDSKDSDVVYSQDSDRTSGYTEAITLKKDTVDTTWDAGARKYSEIGDYVWRDINKNGSQDAGETGISNVNVALQTREGDGGEWKFYGRTVTDDSGYYLFRELKSSDKINTQYRVVFALSPDTQVTVCQQLGIGDDHNSDAINTYQPNIIPATSETSATGGYVTRIIEPAYGEKQLTWDAGIIELLSGVGDYVWYDDNYNGIQEDGENAAADIPVILEYNTMDNPEMEGGWMNMGSAVTDDTGHYLFTNLRAGYYRVRFQMPNGFTATKYDQVADTAIDSDVIIKGADRWFGSRSFYLKSGDTDITWDAGIYKPKRRVLEITRNETTTKNVPKNIVRNTTRTQTRAGKTGDTTDIALLFIMVVLSGTTFVLIYKRRKNGNNSK